MQLLFVVDPLEGLDPKHDSTVAMMESAILQGHEVWACGLSDLGIGRDGAEARAQQVVLKPCHWNGSQWNVPADWLRTGEHEWVGLDRFQAVSMRVDPPVDDNYVRATYVLDHVNPHKTKVVNDPAGLRNANEKLYTLHFRELMPETIVSADRQRIREFAHSVGKAVAKPTDGMAGRGVMLLLPDDPNLASILDVLTERGQQQIMVQAFVAEVSRGDRRVIVVDGQAVGSVTRLAQGDDFRCNMAAGGASQADQIDEDVQRIVDAVGPRLRQDGLGFVGLDVIGDRLSEINVTSPTGIREIQALSGSNPAADYIAYLERTAPAKN